MPLRFRHLSLAVLLALLAVTLPMPQPAFAANFVVNSLLDTDDGSCTTASGGCTLREAINAANANSAADTITFGISGTIAPTSQLPTLTGGGDTIDAGTAHNVVLSGQNLAANGLFGHGLVITSAGNTVRGLVIIGFPGSNDDVRQGGSGIYIFGPAASGNALYNNWIGLNTNGSSAVANRRYGVFIDRGADNNIIGGTGANQPNAISGNIVANILIRNADATSSDALENNQVIGNRIGTNATGTGSITDFQNNEFQGGIVVDRYAQNTLISNNLVGGNIGLPNSAGIILISDAISAADIVRAPRSTRIVGNRIGVNNQGTVIANRVGILLLGGVNFGAVDTVIGDPNDPVAGRNYIGGNSFRGIEIQDTSRDTGDTTIVGNYFGIAPNNAFAANGLAGSTSGGEAIYIGVSSAESGRRTIVGPSNVIAASRTSHIRIRSSNNQVFGNRIGTDPAGSTTSATSATTGSTVGYGSGAISIWVENGSANQIGSPNPADRNIIAAGGIFIGSTGAPILLDPAASSTANNCLGTCVVTNTTIENNYIGVAASGTAALDPAVNVTIDGIRLRATTGNTIRGNVISGLGLGMVFDNNANGNTVADNRIGTRASGASGPTDLGIGNFRHGVRVISGENNTFSDNIIAYNGTDSAFPSGTRYNGVFVSTVNSDNNTFVGNHIARNGARVGSTSNGYGVRVDTSQNVRITQSTTTANFEEGISLANAANAGLNAPTINTPTAGNPTVGGTTGCGSGCTVEIFTSAAAEDFEGPVYLTSTTTTAGGNFSVNVAGCLGFITATVTNSTGSTSPFSAAVDVSGTNACVTGATVTLTAAAPDVRDVAIGSSTIYTHTLSHNASVERTYTIQIASTRGWAAGPSSITLGPNGSVDFGVTVAVPDGTPAATEDVTTVQAVAGSIVSAPRTNRTIAKFVTVNPAAPAVSPGQIRPLTTNQTTFTHTVTNTGDLAGTFSVVDVAFTTSAPAGWSIAPTLADTTLNGGESTTLTIVVTNPTPLPSGDVSFGFRIRVDNGQQTDPLTIDTIDVPVVRSFTFTAQAPTTQSTPPGGSLNYRYTLTNTGNASDTFQVTTQNLTPAAPGITFSVNPNSSFSLAANASRTITVTANIASGVTAQNYTFQARASAVGGTNPPPPAALTAGTQTIQVTGGGVPQFVGAPALNPTVAAANSATDVAITFTVRNVGNRNVNFSFAVPSGGLPAGWTQQSLTDTCPDPVVAGGADCTVTLTVRVPAGQNGGTYPVRLTATALNTPDPNATVTAEATVPVEIVRGVSLSPDAQPNRMALPGTVVTFTHTLTNTGNAPDSFDLSFSQDQLGWTTIVTPTTLLNVPRNASREVSVQVTVPTGVISGTLNAITVTARSQADSNAFDQQVDTVEVQGVNGADLSPGISTSSPVSTTVTFTHTLTNTGSNPLSYSVEASNSQVSWPAPLITSANPTGVLQPGEIFTVTLDVTIPPDASGGISNTTTVQVFAAGDPTLLDSEANRLLVGNPIDVLLTPDREGTALPNTTAVFTHTLTNIGVSQDTYRLTAAEAGGIPVIIAPDLVELGPGQSEVVTLTVRLPIGLRAGSIIFARVTATSFADPTVQGTAIDRITIEQVAGVDLSAAQIRGIGSDGGQIRLDSLSLRNTGNAVDTFNLTFEDVAGAPGGLSLTASPVVVQLDTGDIQRGIAVTVNVPSVVPDERIRRVRVVARSNFDQTITDSIIVDVVYLVDAPPPPPPPLNNRLYLPFLAQ